MVKGQLKFELWVADVHEGKGKLKISDARVKNERRADMAGMVHQRLRTPLQFAHLGFQTPPEPDVAGHIYATCAAGSPLQCKNLVHQRNIQLTYRRKVELMNNI